MFNLSNLLLTSMLATGVATTTPVNHAENQVITTEANDVQQYTEQFVQVNTSNQTYVGYYNQPYTVVQTKTNYSVSSAYVNVIATKYETQAQYTINDQTCLGYANELNLPQESKNIFEQVTRTTYVIQITPYNYNIDTSTTLRLQTVLTNITDEYNHEIQWTSKTLHRYLYQTNVDDWSTYLDRTIVKWQSHVIINDIEDVNNNFYYTKEEYQTMLGNTTIVPYQDYCDIDITPKTTNYIVIDYILAVTGREYDPFNDTYTVYQDDMIPIGTSLYNFNTMSISGTNIIPSGTYEVIDIPGLMWEILTMPFSFVSQAFNLTLFPGTPYQINISNLFLSIIAVLVFVWLITFFLKMKG